MSHNSCDGENKVFEFFSQVLNQFLFHLVRRVLYYIDLVEDILPIVKCNT